MRRTVAFFMAAASALVVTAHAHADEGGVSFWLPGQYGSLAATPSEPGWSLSLVYYHTTSDAGAGKDFPVAGRIAVGLKARADLLMAIPTYTFTTPLWGAQAQMGMAVVAVHMKVTADATLSRPGGASVSGSSTDTLDGLGDLFPSASLRWSNGNHNTMVYTMLGVPVGSYEVGRLANLGANHWAVDGGGGYTYLDAKSGFEFSAVAGFTYNFENPDTDYRNGNSVHLDWGASQFLSEQWHVGVAGYFYNQVTGDSGAGARLGDFKSKVAGIGPQAGYVFKMGARQGYLNLKAYWEFNARNRTEGWNAWVTLVVPIGGG